MKSIKIQHFKNKRFKQTYQHSNEFDEDYRQKVISQTMLKKVGEADDIAKAVEFLLLNAPFITSHILNVDGGRSFSSD